jgi:hypothetical protein
MKGKYGDIPFTRYGRFMYVDDKFYGGLVSDYGTISKISGKSLFNKYANSFSVQ